MDSEGLQSVDISAEIIFNDDEQGGAEKLEIHTNAGHQIILDDSTGQEKIEIINAPFAQRRLSVWLFR